MEYEIRKKKSNLAINTGLIINFLLAIAKTVGGIFATSSALLADGINSTSDVIYYIVVKIFIKASHKPPDVEHPYGHSQLESIAALVVGSFIITTGVAIFWNSISDVVDFFTGDKNVGPGMAALWIAFFTVIIKLLLTSWTSRLGKSTKNAAIIALALDHRNDILASAAALIGIGLGKLGYFWVDPLAGAVVSIVIVKTGISILRESSQELMDAVPGEALRQEILGVLKPFNEIKTIEELHAHRFGPSFIINITIGLDENLNLRQGDDIATMIEKTICRELTYIRKVYVHYHPESQKTGKPSLKLNSLS